MSNRCDAAEEHSGKGHEKHTEGDDRHREPESNEIDRKGDEDSGEENDDSFSSAETNSTVWQDYIDNDAATRLQALSRGAAARRELASKLDR